MSRTFKDYWNDLQDQYEANAVASAKQQRKDVGARALMGYQIEHDDDTADKVDVKQALAEYVREGGFVDFLLGRH